MVTRSFLILAFLCVIGTAIEAQDRHDWQSLAQLQAGDKIRLSLKTGPVTGVFQTWTPEQVTAGTVTARKRGCAQDRALPSWRFGTRQTRRHRRTDRIWRRVCHRRRYYGRLPPGPVWPLHLTRTRRRGSRRRRRGRRRRNRSAASSTQQGTYLFGQITCRLLQPAFCLLPACLLLRCLLSASRLLPAASCLQNLLLPPSHGTMEV